MFNIKTNSDRILIDAFIASRVRTPIVNKLGKVIGYRYV